MRAVARPPALPQLPSPSSGVGSCHRPSRSNSSLAYRLPSTMTSVDEDRAKAAKLAEFNKQFQRSDASPLKENQAPRVVLDGAAVLAKYAGSDSVTSMTGAEYYAMIGHIKRQHGHKGESLEVELMKITRQMDKKIRLLDWINENIAKPSAPAPTPQRAAASPLVSRQAEAPVDISEHAAAGTPSKRVANPTSCRTDLRCHRSPVSTWATWVVRSESPVTRLDRRRRSSTLTCAPRARRCWAVTAWQICSVEPRRVGHLR